MSASVKLQIISRLLPSIIVAAGACVCALHLHRLSAQKTKPSQPIMAILVIAVTALITGLQFFFPEVVCELRRNREALLSGEWWRMVTPLFVQPGGWPHCLFNGVAAVVVCPVAERIYGKKLLALYFIPGVLSEIFGYLWSPNGAGSSLGIAGVVGGLFAYTFLHPKEVSRLARVLVILSVISAVVLCFARDVHGPPILIGTLITVLWPNERAGGDGGITPGLHAERHWPAAPQHECSAEA